jgi:YspA, cpYpsA-related SLOG family
VKIAVVGSRDYPDLRHVEEYIIHVFSPEDILVSGGALGVDRTAHVTCFKLGIKCIIFVPNWELYGKSAGFIRNKLIVKECDRLVAFWHNESRGTENSINEALKANKNVTIIRSDDEVPF